MPQRCGMWAGPDPHPKTLVPVSFLRNRNRALTPERGAARPRWRAEAIREGGAMLGRHVYRVHPTEGRWTVTKEGESQPRGGFANREEALAEARRGGQR